MSLAALPFSVLPESCLQLAGKGGRGTPGLAVCPGLQHWALLFICPSQGLSPAGPAVGQVW